jgi:predicted RNA polymerase sigma factor
MSGARRVRSRQAPAVASGRDTRCAIRADLLRRLGRSAEAALAYEAAIARTDNVTQLEFLQRSRQALIRA